MNFGSTHPKQRLSAWGTKASLAAALMAIVVAFTAPCLSAESSEASVSRKGLGAAEEAVAAAYERKHDYERAAVWYRKAADRGNADAQDNLGWLYENGEGVAKDLKQARDWFQKAAAQKFQPAIDALKKLQNMP